MDERTNKNPLQKLIILRGGPSSGKSTICEEIVKRNNNIVWLHVDSFKRFLRTGDEDVDRDHWYGAAAESLDYYLQNGFPVITECIFQYIKHVQLFVDIAKKNNVEVKVFELIVDPEVLQERDLKRKGVPEGLRKPLSKDTIINLANLVAKNHYQKAKRIDTSKLSTNEVVDKVWNEFKRNLFYALL